MSGQVNPVRGRGGRLVPGDAQDFDGLRDQPVHLSEIGRKKGRPREGGLGVI